MCVAPRAKARRPRSRGVEWSEIRLAERRFAQILENLVENGQRGLGRCGDLDTDRQTAVAEIDNQARLDARSAMALLAGLSRKVEIGGKRLPAPKRDFQIRSLSLQLSPRRHRR